MSLPDKPITELPHFCRGIDPIAKHRRPMTKPMILRFASSIALIVCTHGSAMAQATYFSNVVNSNCVSTTGCTFTFPAFAATTYPGVLTVSKVSCRIVTGPGPNGIAGGILYATLGKTSNATKLEFLSTFSYVYNSSGTFSTNVIDTTTLFFVQSGGAPTVTIQTITPIAAPNASIDQPTCSVAGYIQ